MDPLLWNLQDDSVPGKPAKVKACQNRRLQAHGCTAVCTAAMDRFETISIAKCSASYTIRDRLNEF